jgi:hypothetical protein
VLASPARIASSPSERSGNQFALLAATLLESAAAISACSHSMSARGYRSHLLSQSGTLGKQGLVKADALALDTEVPFTENGRTRTQRIHSGHRLRWHLD